MRIIFFFQFLLLFSCTSSTDKLIVECHQIMHRVNVVRNQYNFQIINRVELVLKSDSREYQLLNDFHDGLNRIDSIKSFGELQDFELCQISDCKLNDREIICDLKFSDADTIYLNSLKNELKDLWRYNIAGKMSYCDDKLNYPLLIQQSNVIEQGKPFKIKCSLGSKECRRIFVGLGVKNNLPGNYSEVEFLPNQYVKNGTWEGYLLEGIDTLRLSIPYEIVECPK